MSTANFSNLQVSTNASNNSQILLRLDNSLSGTAGFSRINRLNFEKSLSFYNIFQTSSANWQNVYTVYATTSASLGSLFTTVQTNSAVQWNYQGTDIKSISGNWQNTYTTFSAQSANNLSVYSTVRANSATNWRGLTIFTQVSSSSITSPNSSIPVHGLSAISLSSSVDFAIIPTLSGALLAQIPDNTITNGRKRGAYATDWQRFRESASTKVASGIFSTIGGGGNNTANGSYAAIAGGSGNIVSGYAGSVGGGTGNTAAGDHSVASGQRSNSRLYGQFSHSSGQFSSGTVTPGDAQYVRWVLRNNTFSNILSSLYLDGVSRRITLQPGYVYSLNFKIMGSNNDATELVEYNKKAVAKCLTTGSPNISIVDLMDIAPPVDTSPADVTVAVDNIDDSINVNVTGVLNADWRWVAVVEGTEMRYLQT